MLFSDTVAVYFVQKLGKCRVVWHALRRVVKLELELSVHYMGKFKSLLRFKVGGTYSYHSASELTNHNERLLYKNLLALTLLSISSGKVQKLKAHNVVRPAI